MCCTNCPRPLVKENVDFSRKKCGSFSVEMTRFAEPWAGRLTKFLTQIIPRLSDVVSNLKTVLELVRSVLKSGKEVSFTDNIAGIENACKAFDAKQNLTVLTLGSESWDKNN